MSPRVLVLIPLLLLSACGLFQLQQQRQQESLNKLNNLIGHLTTTEAISKLGAPAYERKEADGGEILIWTKTTTTSYQREASPFERDLVGAFQPQSSQKITEYRESKRQLILGFDSDGVLRWWRIE
jgi:hypothetical protein